MNTDTDIPPPISLTETIRKIEAGHSLYIKGDPQTVRTTIARVKQEFRKRAYQTKRERGGIRVWRLA